MDTLSNFGYSSTDYLFIIISVISILILTSGIPTRIKLEYTIRNHKELPASLSIIPELNISQDNYIIAKNKIRYFMDSCLKNKNAELTLNIKDINNVNLRGEPIDLYSIDFCLSPLNLSIPILFPRFKNIFYYFELIDNNILEKRVEYPVSSGINGVQTDTISYSFERHKEHPRIRRKHVERNGRSLINFCEKKYDFIIPLSKSYNILEPSLASSNFLFHLFGVTLSPSENPSKYKYTDNYKRVLSAIEKIQTIHVVDDILIIKSRPDIN